MIKLNIMLFEDTNVVVNIKTTSDTKGIAETYKEITNLQTKLNEVTSTQLMFEPHLKPDKATAEAEATAKKIKQQVNILTQGMFKDINTSELSTQLAKIDFNSKLFDSDKAGMSDFYNAWNTAIGNVEQNTTNIGTSIKNNMGDSIIDTTQKLQEFQALLDKTSSPLSFMDKPSAGWALEPPVDTSKISAEQFQTAWNNAFGSATDGANSFKDALENMATKCQPALDSLKKKVQDFGKTSTSTFKSVLSTFGIVASVVGVTKYLKKAVVSAADYEESLNLFTMALQEHFEEGTKWAKKFSEALYLDDSEVMQYAGSFYNLTKGLGASSDAAYKMATNLTQLTYDMSSYLNIDPSKANAKLMSAMSGQTKAVTSVGIAVQSASLQELAHELKIKKKVSTMTQAEKTYLRYIQIMRSTKNMQGDLGRTIITPANAFRMLSTQVQLLGRALGQVLTPIIYKVMPILIALTRVLTDAAKSLAKFFGYEIQDIDYSSVQGTTKAVKGLGKEVDKTAAKAHRMLAPFDELNTVANESGGSGGGGGSILSQLEKQLTGYDPLKDLNKNMQSSISQWEERIKNFGSVALGVIGAITGLKLIKKIFNLGKSIGDLGSELGIVKIGADGTFSSVAQFALKFTTVVTGVITSVIGMQKTFLDVKNNTDTLNNSVVDATMSIGGMAAAGAAIGGPMGALIGSLVGFIGYVGAAFAGYEAYLHNLALEEVNKNLGNLNITTQQWLNTLLGGDSKLTAIIDKIDEFDKGLKKSSEDFTIASTKAEGDIVLYSSQVGKYATVSKEMLTTITNDMQSMVNSSSAGIKNSTDATVYALEQQMEGADEKTKKWLKSIQEEVANHGIESEKTIKKHSDGIIDIYTKANKSHRKLTKEELENVNKHFNAMNEEYVKFSTDNVAELKAMFNKEGKLRDGFNADSIKNFAAARDKYLETNSKATEKLYEQTEKSAKKLLDSETINQEEYNAIIKQANKTRQMMYAEAGEKVNTYAELMRINIEKEYTKLNGSTKKTAAEEKKILEGLYGEDLHMDTRHLKKEAEKAVQAVSNPWDNAGEKAATLFTNDIKTTLNRTTFTVKVKTEWANKDKTTMNITPYAVSVKKKADGGYLDRGDLFVANEAGPEYITSIGNKSAVVNQGQMVAALSNAIVTALNGKVNNGGRQNVVVYLGNEKLYEGQGQYQNRQNDRYGTTVVKI